MGRSNVILKAIETRYRGYRFRSRLEARWAVFLDAISEPWEYEKEGYSLPSGAYLPDFWLPRMSLWLEIKPEQPTNHELTLAEELAVGTDFPVVFGIGLPLHNWLKVFCGDTSDSSGGCGWWECCQWSYCDEGVCIDSNCEDSQRSFCTPSLQAAFSAMKKIDCFGSARLSVAATRAKSARFEHGEKG